MKTRGLFKYLILIVLLFVLHLSVCGQESFLRSDKDSTWIEQALRKANERRINNKDTIQVTHKWISGKILYCSDGLLKATQLTADPDSFTTTIQYIYKNKIREQKVDYSDISNYSLNKIYRLPGKKPAYLFLLSKIEHQPDYKQDSSISLISFQNPPGDTDLKRIKRLTYAAVVLRFEKDSLVEIPFPRSPADADDDPLRNSTDAADTSYVVATNAIIDTNSFCFTSFISQLKKSPKPFLKYDAIAHTLGFLNIYCKNEDDSGDCTQPVLNVESGIYLYKDSSFVQASDTTYYYPSMKDLTKTVAHRNYKAGKYIIRARAIEGYEEEYGSNFGQTLTKEYKIGTQTLTDFNNEEWEKINLKPDYHLQSNSSLILLLEDETNGHSPGMCGAASYFDNYFWLVDGKSSQQLFSFSTSSCFSEIKYTFTRSGKHISGSLYLNDLSDHDYFGPDDSYWKNDSTYVFVISDETNLSRNFYVHFNVLDKNDPVKLIAGKLYKKKAKLRKRNKS